MNAAFSYCDMPETVPPTPIANVPEARLTAPMPWGERTADPISWSSMPKQELRVGGFFAPEAGMLSEPGSGQRGAA